MRTSRFLDDKMFRYLLLFPISTNVSIGVPWVHVNRLLVIWLILDQGLGWAKQSLLFIKAFSFGIFI